MTETIDTAQPEALRLAEILEGDYCPDWLYEVGTDQIAAELRRLHSALAAAEARNATLTDEAARDRADALRYREVRLGRYWSVINGIGDELRGDALDAAVGAVLIKMENPQ